MSSSVGPSYCALCSMPFEYCAWSPSVIRCKASLKENNISLFAKYYPEEALAEGMEMLEVAEVKDSKVAKEGKEEVPLKKDDIAKRELKEAERLKKARVVIQTIYRSRKKSVTHILGMEDWRLDIKAVCKKFANKFACGCAPSKNASGHDEIVIQGDFADELTDLICEFYPQIPRSQIEVQKCKKK